MAKGSLILDAFVLFFFLFLTPVYSQCRSAKQRECDNALHVPGTDFANWGIDITTMERKKPYTVNEYQMMDLNEWENPDGSCTLCTNTLEYRKPLQRVQQAITNWKANISCQQKVQHYVTMSPISLVAGMIGLSVKNDWKEDLDVEVKSYANAQWILVGSDSDWTSFIKKRISRDQYIFLLHHVSCSYYKFSINKNKSVSRRFRHDVRNLPRKYDYSSKRKYRDLIKSYGTHFLSELDLGVRVTIVAALPVCRMAVEVDTLSEISHCLEIEVGQVIDIDNVNKNSELNKCIRKLGEPDGRWLGKEQLRDIEGGDYSHISHINGILSLSNHWLESVVSKPGLLSYSLESLHTLLDKRDPRREGLRQAVSEYVRERALWMNCTNICPPGVQLSASDSCFCECTNDNFTTSMCCPQQRGLAKLTVTIQRAEGLWGDYITHTDAYVNVFYTENSNRKVLCTSTLWNKNNPIWNENLDFGIIQFTELSRELEIKVWDEDFGWDDDILGRCILTLDVGDSSDLVCPMTKGSLHYKYHLACVPYLGGPFCSDYIPLRSNESI